MTDYWTILKVNGGTNIKDDNSKGEDSLSEEIINPNNTEELILTSYEISIILERR